MLTINMRISDEADASLALVEVEKRCKTLNLVDRKQIIEDVKEIAHDLECRGKELASIGSQFRVVKIRKFKNCNVQITANYGISHRKSLPARLWSFLRGM
jgi:hypothetical protein